MAEPLIANEHFVTVQQLLHQLRYLERALPQGVGFSNANALIITDALGENVYPSLVDCLHLQGAREAALEAYIGNH